MLLEVVNMCIVEPETERDEVGPPSQHRSRGEHTTELRMQQLQQHRHCQPIRKLKCSIVFENAVKKSANNKNV